MDAALREKSKEAMAQVNAIFALEGFEPTAEDAVIDAAIVDGRVSIPQLIAEMSGYVREHKTMNGFVESRSWTWLSSLVLERSARLWPRFSLKPTVSIRFQRVMAAAFRFS